MLFMTICVGAPCGSTPAHSGQCKQAWAVPRSVRATFTTSLHRTPWYAHHHSYFLHGISTDGFKGCEIYLQSRMLPQTSLAGRHRSLFTHSFSPYGPISLSHSLCQHAFTDLELTLLLLCCIMSLLVIVFLLDWMKGFSSTFWMDSKWELLSDDFLLSSD